MRHALEKVTWYIIAFEKNIFVYCAVEYLERLVGKVRKCLFLYVEIFKNNSVMYVVWGVSTSNSVNRVVYFLPVSFKIYGVKILASKPILKQGRHRG